MVKTKPYSAGKRLRADMVARPCTAHATVENVRTRLRKLQVGGRDFVWRARIGFLRGDGVDVHRCINIRVWGAGKNSRPLVADLLSTSMSVGWTPAATDSAYPATSDIQQLIACALRLGWEVEARGRPFLLTESSGLELPGFLITDRVRNRDAMDPTALVLRANESQPTAGSG